MTRGSSLAKVENEIMNLIDFDSRTFLGTDIEYSRYPDSPADVNICVLYPPRQEVRVIVGELGGLVRMSAPGVGIVVEAPDRGQAWAQFIEEIRKRDDRAWLAFDVGPTRIDEIAEGLDAPEDEDWSGLMHDPEV